MAEIEEAIWNYLTGIAELQDIDGFIPTGQIGWVDLDQDVNYPRIVFKNISRPVLYQFPDQWQRFRFYILAPDKYTCVRLGRILSDSFEALTGEMGGKTISYVTKIEDEDPMYQELQQVYELTQDYRFIFL